MDEAKLSNNIQRFEKLRSSLSEEVDSLKGQNEHLNEILDRVFVCLDSFESLGNKINQTIENSIPGASDKISKNSINSIKMNLTKELQLGMDELKTNIDEYGNELRHFKQSVRETSYISRNSIAFICGSSFLGAALTAAAIYSWSWYNLGDENLYNLRVGAHVQSILKPLPPEVQNGFWERFKKLEQPQK